MSSPLSAPPAASVPSSAFGLQRRFLTIVGVVTLMLSLLVWAVFNSVVDHLVQRLGVRFAEKQVLYDKSRTLQPLIREVALARAMADDPVIRRWAADENNPELRESALNAMEKHRRHFQDGSYFIALAASNNYYYNNAAGEFTAQPLRYTLDPQKESDAWFFATLKNPAEYNINVDPDVSLGVTKVWINVVLREQGRALALIGTGIDLTRFIKEVAAIPQPGITNLFIDKNAAIQLYRDIDFIDFSSIAKSVDQQRSINQLMTAEADRYWVHSAMKRMETDETRVETRFVQVNGTRMLAAIARLPEVGWFSVTLLDLRVLLPKEEFAAMGVAIGLAAFGILLVLIMELRRQVLQPVNRLARATDLVSSGAAVDLPVPAGSGEVDELTKRFVAMADAVEKNRSSLTDALQRRLRDLTNAKHLADVALAQERDGREKQSNMLSMLAHEVRNPMATISNAAELLRLKVPRDNAEVHARIEKILGGVSRVRRVLDTVMAEERLAISSLSIPREKGELNDLERMLADVIADTPLHTIEFHAMAGDSSLWVDWQLLGIAVANLIDNAAKYSPAGSRITVTMGRESQAQLYVEVADNGVGIAPEAQQRIFGKFERGNLTEHVPGTGLGLYLVKFIADLHGGRVEVASQPGQGSRFRISIPVRRGTTEV